MSQTANDGNQSTMQETKPDRTTARLTKECQDFFEWMVCVSELENWQCEVPELSNVDKIGFLRLTGASFFVDLHFWAFGSSFLKTLHQQF